jgi:hypothetical protein
MEEDGLKIERRRFRVVLVKLVVMLLLAAVFTGLNQLIHVDAANSHYQGGWPFSSYAEGFRPTKTAQAWVPWTPQNTYRYYRLDDFFKRAPAYPHFQVTRWAAPDIAWPAGSCPDIGWLPGNYAPDPTPPPAGLWVWRSESYTRERLMNLGVLGIVLLACAVAYRPKGIPALVEQRPRNLTHRPAPTFAQAMRPLFRFRWRGRSGLNSQLSIGDCLVLVWNIIVVAGTASDVYSMWLNPLLPMLLVIEIRCLNVGAYWQGYVLKSIAIVGAVCGVILVASISMKNAADLAPGVYGLAGFSFLGAVLVYYWGDKRIVDCKIREQEKREFMRSLSQ